MSECNFALDHYRECLLQAKKNDYTFITMSQAFDESIQTKTMMMRHDVDHQLDLAMNMASLEKDNGVVSTYFFRISARNYNLFSWEGISTVKKILKMGHEVGLHYEKYINNNEVFTQYMEHNLDILRLLFGENTFRCICPHEPSRSNKVDPIIIEHLKKNKDVLYDAYDDKMFEEYKYISDSSCNWREGCLHHHIGKHHKLYVLTHPVWWYKINPGECY
jgi:hypothetical protein